MFVCLCYGEVPEWWPFCVCRRELTILSQSDNTCGGGSTLFFYRRLVASNSDNVLRYVPGVSTRNIWLGSAKAGEGAACSG